MIGLCLRDGAKAAEIRLQISHEQRGGNTFSGDVSDHETETALTKIEKIIVVAANFPSLDTHAGVFQAVQWRLNLWEEARLHVLSDLELVGGKTFSFLLGGGCASLRLHGVSELVEAEQRKNCGAVGSPTPNPSPTEWHAGMKRNVEPKLLNEKARLRS